MTVSHIAIHWHTQRTFQQHVEKAYHRQKLELVENNRLIQLHILDDQINVIWPDHLI